MTTQSIEGAMPPLPDLRQFHNSVDGVIELVMKRYGQECADAAAAPLIARVAELQADAARWRELRRSHEESDSGESICVFEPDHGAHCLQPIGSMPGELDTAIDAAIAARKEQP